MTVRRDYQKVPMSLLVDPEALGGRGRGLMFLSGESVCAEDVNLMARYARGLVSVALDPAHAFELGLKAMTPVKPDCSAAYFVASVEAVACTETGISAAERALTIATMAGAEVTADDLMSPGHVMPLVVPPGAEETSLPGLALIFARHMADTRVIAWCDILGESGDVADIAECLALGAELDLPVYARRGAAAVEFDQLNNAKIDPTLPVRKGGIDIGQFA